MLVWYIQLEMKSSGGLRTRNMASFTGSVHARILSIHWNDEQMWPTASIIGAVPEESEKRTR
jgi:hypothetical protein